MPPPGGPERTSRGRRSVARSTPRRDQERESLFHHLKEAVISAIIAAVLFGIALLLHVFNQAIGPLDTTFFMLAGLLAAALHLAGIGSSRPARVRH